MTFKCGYSHSREALAPADIRCVETVGQQQLSLLGCVADCLVEKYFSGQNFLQVNQIKLDLLITTQQHKKKKK